MRESRSSSQILFSLLPQQTVDLKGRIWRVDEWLDPIPLAVDVSAIRKRLVSAIDPWTKANNDAGATAELYAGHSIDVVGLNKNRGVHVEAWPNTWICTDCRRLGTSRTATCRCGKKRWGQLHFVGYHDCGHLAEPWIPRCQTHGEVAVRTPGSSNVNDLVFYCPVCKQTVQRGLGGGRPCPGCRKPGLLYNVHRAASVYSPHSFTMVNPPRPEQLRDLLSQGGASRCLDWVLDGMPGSKPSLQASTRRTFVESLVAQGLPQLAAEAAADAAAAQGHAFSGDDDSDDLDMRADRLDAARDDAFDLALAVHEGRRGTSDLKTEPVGPELANLYTDSYPPAMARAGVEEIDLVDRFPVLRGVFGYSRGGGQAGDKRLVMFRGKGGAYRVYADAAETEALLVRLDPLKVCAWLHQRGLLKAVPPTVRDARLAILSDIDVPERGADINTETIGSAVLTLLHSYTHRLIRQLAVMAGIDRESLAEYLVPRHLAAFVYAGPRGDFVLGGLQAVFETDLEMLLDRQTNSESRCPLDPGCSRGAGACLACLHLGEPSCTHYNRFLDRSYLFGRNGYLTMGG